MATSQLHTMPAQARKTAQAKSKKRIAPPELLAALHTLPDPSPNAPCTKQYSNGFVAFRSLFNALVVKRYLPAAAKYQGVISGEAGRRWRLFKNTLREDDWTVYAARSLRMHGPNPNSRGSRRQRARQAAIIQNDSADTSSSGSARHARSGKVALGESQNTLLAAVPASPSFAPSSSSCSPSLRDTSISPGSNNTLELPLVFENAFPETFAAPQLTQPSVELLTNTPAVPYYDQRSTFASYLTNEPYVQDTLAHFALNDVQPYTDSTFAQAVPSYLWTPPAYDSSSAILQYEGPYWDAQSSLFGAI